MEVTLVTLSQLFANNFEQFIVPAYQRRYSWTKNQIEELFNDINLIINSCDRYPKNTST